MNTPTLVAKSVLINPEGKILILTRSQTDKQRPGGLDLPGGQVDGDEEIKAAAIRELQEEIGVTLEPAVFALVYSSTNEHNGDIVIRFMFVTQINSDTPIKLSYEHDNYEWMGLNDIRTKYDHPVWVGAIDYAIEHDLLPVSLAD